MGYFPCSDCFCLVKSFENDSRGSGQELDTTRTTGGGRDRRKGEREGRREIGKERKRKGGRRVWKNGGAV